MPIEATRGHGTEESIHLRGLKGRFSGFLKKISGVQPELQSTQQRVPKIIKPPPGLEDFTTGLKQGIDNHFTSVRQQELDRQNAEVSRLSAEALKKAQEETKQKELAEQERIRREKDIAEANKILENFRIKERLEYIRDTVWEGRGKVKPLEPKPSWLGGFELVHEYPSLTKQEETLHAEGGCEPNYRMKYVPRTDSTHLRIAVIDNSQMSISSHLDSDRFSESPPYSGVFHKTWGWTGDPRGIIHGYDRNEPVIVQMDIPESETLLQEAIVGIIVDRIARRVLPAQLEEEAKFERRRLPNWQKWNREYSTVIYDEQHPWVDIGS